MKRILFNLLLPGWLLLSAGLLLAQTTKPDLLYKLDRTTMKATVTEMTEAEVFYTDLATPTIPRRIRKAELWKVVFSDGTSDVFNTPKNSSAPVALAKQSITARKEPALVAAEPAPRATVREERNPVRPGVQTDGPQSIIKYAPLSSFGYERVLKNNHSIYAGLSLYSLGYGVSAIGLKGEYRFYGLIKDSPKQAPEGFWVAPTVLFWNVSVRDFYETESAFVVQLGAIAGYQWVFNRKISLEPALGLSLTAVGSGTDSVLGAGLVPLFAVRVGYVLK